MSDTSPNWQTELAKQRNRIAADRTLLAWIRTSMALIGIGFGLERTVNKLYLGIETTSNSPTFLVKVFSLLIIGTGIFSILMASFDYQNEIKRLQKPDYYYTPRQSLGIIVSGILVLIAVSIFLTIWRQAIIN
ncbi:YidH family protein [Crocosphaera chwakensis]|uniref:DUF202 domain-containing protein n=1 Tax=Crocosphaera chwakensis CCY0110 TaxID=391612 RepID=A3IW44_9CHRO|nr:DUF202 domain-containing protein [Crocosphaera chwakensis]EAZ89279.1 hypothetical protein CY0110_08791 [Crocosphaera chwakensis CCY0110]